MITLHCIICDKTFSVYNYRQNTAKVCSSRCRGILVGKIRRERAVPIYRSMGYMYIKKQGHYRADKQGYVKVADLILEEKLGRPLKDNEIAHHIDNNKLNDKPENLEVMDNREHTLMHHEARRKKENTKSCLICKTVFSRPGRKDAKKYCSRECMSIGFRGQYHRPRIQTVQQ
jgi:predicted nucleic acid-binding Zn ribbon protein